MKFLPIIAIFTTITIFARPTFGVPFDSNHCKRKCESLFSDSPNKKSLCLGTCSNEFLEREKIVYKYNYGKNNNNNYEYLSKCLANCSKNINSATNFNTWTKCRKTCVLSGIDKENHRYQYLFFGPDECNDECDRYWRGTVHWEPCQQQCKSFDRNYSEQKKNNVYGDKLDKLPKNSQKMLPYDLW